MERKPPVSPAPPEAHHEGDLTVSLEQLKTYWNNYGGIALVVILVGVIIYMGTSLYLRTESQAHEQAWSDLAFATSPEGFRDTALTHDDPVVRALANLRGADLLMMRLLEPVEVGGVGGVGGAGGAGGAGDVGGVGIDDLLSENDEELTVSAPPPVATSSDFNRDEALDDAAAMYQRVVGSPGLHKVYGLNAHLGLAAVAETRGEWEQAATLYQSLVDQAGDAYPSIASTATGRLAILDRMKNPIIFAPPEVSPANLAPKVTPEVVPDITPASEPVSESTPSSSEADASIATPSP